MKTLSIDLGINEYQLAPDCIVTFNPTDTGFIKTLFDTFNKLDDLETEYKKRLGTLSEPGEILGFFAEHDKSMREIIDSVFDVPICNSVFGDVRVSAMSANGVPVWVELFLALIDQCDTDAVGLAGKGKKYIDKYTKKYQKK